LDNRERVLRPLWERRMKIANFIFLVNSMLKKVSSNGKQKGGERISLPDTTNTSEVFSSSSIQEHRSSPRAKKLINPHDPFLRETLCLQHIKNSRVFNQVECFLNV
jgi:hypothetical protein